MRTRRVLHQKTRTKKRARKMNAARGDKYAYLPKRAASGGGGGSTTHERYTETTYLHGEVSDLVDALHVLLMGRVPERGVPQEQTAQDVRVSPRQHFRELVQWMSIKRCGVKGFSGGLEVTYKSVKIANCSLAEHGVPRRRSASWMKKILRPTRIVR